jgi:hypothetical protein
MNLAALAAAQSFVDWINTLPTGTGPGQVPEGYSYSLDHPGKRYVRIVMDAKGSKSVHAFVDVENGDLLKAAGWKAPAKGARGNLIDGLDEVQARFTWSSGYLYAR